MPKETIKQQGCSDNKKPDTISSEISPTVEDNKVDSGDSHGISKMAEGAFMTDGNSYHTSDFFFDLPQELIAQTPIEPRDASRLLVLKKQTGEIEDLYFSDILDLISEKDCLILNDSRVLPARIYGTRKDSGSRVEFLLLQNHGNNLWEVLAGPGKKAKKGTEFLFGESSLSCVVEEVLESGNRIIRFFYSGNFFHLLEQVGQMPLPPYIKEKLDDQERYQTVYSKEVGSAAAPTAGLHFTPELLLKLKAKGVKIGFVTLHVGLGTFRPVNVEKITDHKMHAEHYEMSQETANLINETKRNGGRVIAVGTTSSRTIETIANANDGVLMASTGWTDIFIYPGYVFRGVDALITNFHLPESTLIMLISALAGKDKIMKAYAHAVQAGYRFFSFGDAMLIE